MRSRNGWTSQPLPGTGIDPAHPLSIVSCWAMNEASGRLLGDAGPMGNAMTLVGGTTWTLTRSGMGTRYSSSYAAARQPGGVGAGSFTLFAWGNTDGSTDAQNFIRQDNGSPRAIYGIRSVVNQAQFFTFDGSLQQVNQAGSLGSGLHLHVGVRDLERNTLTLYLDALSQGTVTGTTANLETGGNLNLGRDPSSGVELLAGSLLLAGFANRAWSAAEVAGFTANPWLAFAAVRRGVFASSTGGARSPAGARVITQPILERPD